jgi:hypothetical protein
MPSININLAVNPTRLAQVVVGGAAAFAGYQAANSIIRNAYHEDLLGDPTRVVEVDDRTVIYQQREPQGDKLTNIMLGAGAAGAFGGGALLAWIPEGATGAKAVLRNVGAAGLFAIGAGAAAGAIASWAVNHGTDFHRVD